MATKSFLAPCFIALAALTLIAGCSKPPLSDAQKKVAAKVQADKCAAALLRGDNAAVIDSMFPKIVEMGGGRQKVIDLLESSRSKALAEGFSIHNATLGDVKQLVTDGTLDYVVIPETIEMASPDGIGITESYLLGMSEDGGRTWKFVDGNGVAAARSALPKLPATLVLPPAYPPQ